MMNFNKYELFKSFPPSLGWHLYVHIPFCPRKCRFCMYYTVRNFNQRTIKKLLFFLTKEVRIYCNLIIKNNTHIAALDSIYFGGGTPAELGSEGIGKILEVIRESFPTSDQTEITVEAFPDQQLLNNIEQFAQIGVTRLSVGVQTMDAETLEASKRPSSSLAQIYKIVSLANTSGIRVNIDLMYGLPSQTENEIFDTLYEVLHLRPDHITNYRCVSGPYTAAFRLRKEENYSSLPIDRLIAVEKSATRVIEGNGYTEYTAGHFASSSAAYSVHETGVWRGDDLLGIGPAAMSFIGGTLYKNYPNIAGYGKHLENGFAVSVEALEHEDVVRRTALLSLVKGLRLSVVELENRYGHIADDLKSDLDVLVERGIVHRAYDGSLITVKQRIPQLIFEFSKFQSSTMSKNILLGGAL